MNLIQKIVSFYRDKTLSPDRSIFNMWEHRGWGNRIEFSNFDKRRLNGHLPNRRAFKKGTEVREKMQSGQVGRFVMTEVEYTPEPKDMFFATVKDIGYLEAPPHE